MKLSCNRVGATFTLSAIQEDGTIERIVYDFARNVVLEMVVRPKFDGPYSCRDMAKLRDMLGFVRKTCDTSSSDSLKVYKWSEGGVMLEEGIIDPSRPLRVIAGTLVRDYENVESLLLDGWR